MSNNPLGEKSDYPRQYDPDLLYAIPRWASRSLLNIDKRLPIEGFDFWRAYELSWLDKHGRPQVAMGEFYFDARSENLVESKSLKLYLNSLNNEKFTSSDEFSRRVAKDLEDLTVSEVQVVVRQLTDSPLSLVHIPPGKCIDDLLIENSGSQPDPKILKLTGGKTEHSALYSNLFRSNCPITGQPDWATVMVQYTGPTIDEQSLVAYLCSFRQHAGYHEECTEIIYRDLMFECEPDSLVVGMNFVRRGGIDINPFRSNQPVSPDRLTYRFVRQ